MAKQNLSGRGVLQRDHPPSRATRYERAAGSQAFAARTRSLPVGGVPDVQPRCSDGTVLADALPAVRSRAEPTTMLRSSGSAETVSASSRKSRRPGRDWSTASNEVSGTKSPAPWFCFRPRRWFRPSHQLDQPNSQANHPVSWPSAAFPVRAGFHTLSLARATNRLFQQACVNPGSFPRPFTSLEPKNLRPFTSPNK